MFKKFFVDVMGEDVPYKDYETKDYMSALVDITGLLYDIDADIYGTGDRLDGKPKKQRSKEIEDIEKKKKTKEGLNELRFLYKLKLKDVLSRNFINNPDLNVQEVLIIALDGKAFPAKQKQQRSRRFVSALQVIEEQSEKDFDTLNNFTVGSDTMVWVTECINEWINENKSKLPFVYFSDGAEEGEAEHKMYNILERVIDEIDATLLKEYDSYAKKSKKGKNVRHFFELGNHLIIGKDSDLFFLSAIRSRYHFFWKKDLTTVYKSEENQRKFGYNIAIEPVRKYIFSKMYKAPEDVEHNDFTIMEKRRQCIHDFVFFSFHIGDDFVPGMFCLDIHIGIALVRFMEHYSENNYTLTVERKGDLRINLPEYKRFLENFKVEEEKFFNWKKKTQKLEHDKVKSVKDNTSFDGEAEYHKNRKSLQVDYDKYKFLETKLLNGTYEEFQELWKKQVICPNYLKMKSSERKVIDALESIDEDFGEACFSYIRGLQWNLSYYYGVKNLSNWSYMWMYAPTFSQLVDYFPNGTYLKSHLDDSRDEMPLSTIYFTIFNCNLSSRFLNRISLMTKQTKAPIGKKRLEQVINVEERLNVSRIFLAFNPTGFRKVIEGKYVDKNNIFGETVLLPMVPLEIQEEMKEIKTMERATLCLEYNDQAHTTTSFGEFDSDYLQGSVSSNLINKMFDRSINFGENEVKEFSDKKETKHKKKKVKEDKGARRNTIGIIDDRMSTL